jgi:hypothetical protein
MSSTEGGFGGFSFHDGGNDPYFNTSSNAGVWNQDVQDLGEGHDLVDAFNDASVPAVSDSNWHQQNVAGSASTSVNTLAYDATTPTRSNAYAYTHDVTPTATAAAYMAACNTASTTTSAAYAPVYGTAPQAYAGIYTPTAPVTKAAYAPVYGTAPRMAATAYAPGYTTALPVQAPPSEPQAFHSLPSPSPTSNGSSTVQAALPYYSATNAHPYFVNTFNTRPQQLEPQEPRYRLQVVQHPQNSRSNAVKIKHQKALGELPITQSVARHIAHKIPDAMSISDLVNESNKRQPRNSKSVLTQENSADDV